MSKLTHTMDSIANFNPSENLRLFFESTNAQRMTLNLEQLHSLFLEVGGDKSYDSNRKQEYIFAIVMQAQLRNQERLIEQMSLALSQQEQGSQEQGPTSISLKFETPKLHITKTSEYHLFKAWEAKLISVLAQDKLDHVICTEDKCTEQERKDIYMVILNSVTGIPLSILISNNEVKDGCIIFKLFKEKFQSASSLDWTSIKDDIKLLHINKGQDVVVILNEFNNLYKDLIE